MSKQMMVIDTNNIRGEIIVNVNYGNNDSIPFTLTGVVSKKSGSKIDEANVYKIVNAYLDYKGEVFKSDLYAALQTAYTEIHQALLIPGIIPLPLKMVHDILDMFDLLDLFNFLKHVFRLPPPSDLKDEFDKQTELDKQATRVQTYLKDDYIELAALTVIIKVAVLPIAQYGLIKAKDIRKDQLEYVLFTFLRTHKIFESSPMVKLLGHITLSVKSPTNTATAIDVSVIDNQIPRSELPAYLLSIVVMQRLSITDLLKDCNDTHVVTEFYTYVNSRIKGDGDRAGGIRDKRLIMSTDAEGEQESFIESNRLPVALSSGAEEEMNWCFETIEKVMAQLPKSIRDTIDPEVLMDAEEFAVVFNNGNIADVQVELLGILFKSIVSAKALDYLSAAVIIKLIAVGFAYLWGMGFKHLALLLMSQSTYQTDVSTHTVNNVVGRERLSQEVKDQLDLIAPNRRPINATTSANILEEWINLAATNITRITWIQVPNKTYVKYIVSALGNNNYRNLLTSGIRVQLAEMIIKNEELSYV